MSEPRKIPEFDKWNWKPSLTAAWNTLPVETIAEAELELLAAYSEGGLTNAERASCEELLSRNPDALQLVEDLWSHHHAISRVEASPRAPTLLHARSFALQWLFQAACVAIGVMGVGWGLMNNHRSRQANMQLAIVEERWAETQLELGIAHKERFLAEAISPVGSYWSGTSTPPMLDAVRGRGDTKPTPKVLAQADQTKQVFEKLHDALPRYAGQAALELVSVEIAAGRLDAAEELLRETRRILGDVADVENAHAVWLLAKGDQASVDEAERRLQLLVRTHPDFVPGWYNLAILLQQRFQDEKSKAIWQEYLKREQRPEYRDVAQRHLRQLAR